MKANMNFCPTCGAMKYDTCIDLLRQQELPNGIYHKSRIPERDRLDQAPALSEALLREANTLLPSPSWKTV